MKPKELEQAIRSLLRQRMSDAELRERLEQLAAVEISFSGFTWLWGPELYRRNRVLFRPFIVSRFSSYMILPKWKTESIAWKGDKEQALNAWLSATDLNDDALLFRKLYDWKMTSKFDLRLSDRKRTEEIFNDLLGRFRSATSPARRQMVLRKFDLWLPLDEEKACRLYECDPRSAGPFILNRLPSRWFSGERKRALWKRLLDLADRHRDDNFQWKLYRRQVPLEEWTRECLELCSRISDGTELVRELEKRHPEAWGLNLSDAFFQIVRYRGRDVLPYVMRRLRQVWGGWFSRGSYGKMVDYAQERGWWDLWSALIRVCSTTKEFNKEIHSLLESKTLSETDVAERLLALAGVSREWNWPGLGFAAVHQLEEPTALLLYERFPDLVRGPYKIHVQPHIWGRTYSNLLDRFLAVGDEEMIDQLASRIVTRSGRWGKAREMLADAEKLADYYAPMKSDEAVFCRRAANVLGKVPAYSIWKYNQLIKENRLARLLFERSAASYLADPDSLADLVEAAEIHVMALAYRALGLDDDRARAQAARNLPLLLGTLLRPMQRATRILAFSALDNAASTPESARKILERAKDAFNLPDKHYPKEQLLGLIAKVLSRRPELRGANEHPVVFERSA
jgi:hypothetical protein